MEIKVFLRNKTFRGVKMHEVGCTRDATICWCERGGFLLPAATTAMVGLPPPFWVKFMVLPFGGFAVRGEDSLGFCLNKTYQRHVATMRLQ